MGVGVRIEDFFEGAAGKVLSAVEADPRSSNQHEFNGARPLVELLGFPPASGEKRRFSAAYVYLDDEADPLVVEASATWYDARANQPNRSAEYRFYYPAGLEVMTRARGGDYLVIAKPKLVDERELVVIVANGSSSVAAQLESMFGLEPATSFDVETLESGEDLTIASRRLLEALGYDLKLEDDRFLEDLVNRFGSSFPTTALFSAYARVTLPGVDSRDDADAALLAWCDREEVLFRTFERHLLIERIRSAGSDIDEVLRLAMSAFQRRKSRAGHSLENHVAEVLRTHGIPFEAQAKTEGKVRPDFLVPDGPAYHDPAFPVSRLRMLAVKTTCKDRWRQVVSEAARVRNKHLLTLEAPISTAQLTEMRAHSVLPIVPASLHDLFGGDATRLLSVRETLAEFATVTKGYK